MIRRVDLGSKGVYYRAMVGPLSSEQASELCSRLKSAGGACIIQKI
jgi:SPOR domain